MSFSKELIITLACQNFFRIQIYGVRMYLLDMSFHVKVSWIYFSDFRRSDGKVVLGLVFFPQTISDF